MKAAKVSEIKQELSTRSHKELLELCLRLSKFKKENKELLTYLLYEADNEAAYIAGIKQEIEYEFTQINTKTFYYIKKSVRKILRTIKKYIRYSKEKETEVELLIFFCHALKNMSPSIKSNVTLQNILNRQLDLARKTLSSLHEDLQYDYKQELESFE